MSKEQIQRIKDLASKRIWFSVDVNKEVGNYKTWDFYSFRFHDDECGKTTPGFYCTNGPSFSYIDDIENLIEQGWTITKIKIDDDW